MKWVIKLHLLFILTTACSISSGQNIYTTFVHATVIDVEKGKLLKDYTVEVSGNKIVSVQLSAKSRFTKGKRIVDAKGKFIIPGLWDMHAHSMDYPDFEQTGLLLFVANGVTGIRDMGSDKQDWKRWRSMPDSIVTPRVFAAGKIIDGPREGGNVNPERIEVHNAEEGTNAVDSLANTGVNFIKVHDWVSEDSYKAIIKEAKIKHLDVAGHAPVVLDARMVSNAGQKSIEHLGCAWGGFLIECSKKEKELRLERQSLAKYPFGAKAYAAINRAPKVNELIDYFDSSKAIELGKLLRKNHTWITPTLIVLKNFLSVPDSSFAKDPLFKYLPYEWQQYIKRSPTSWWQQFSAEDILSWDQRFQLQMKLTGILRKANVQLLAASDNDASFRIIPGFGLHDELSLLVQAGLSPLESLQAATLNPAKYFGTEDKLGTIKAGHLADFVILNANPLDNIENTRNICGVMMNGHYFDRDELDALLLKVANRNRRKP